MKNIHISEHRQIFATENAEAGGRGEVRKMDDLSERDRLFNIVLETVQKNASGMEIGLVSAVLAEVDGEISRKASYLSFDTVCEKLKKREPRERK